MPLTHRWTPLEDAMDLPSKMDAACLWLNSMLFNKKKFFAQSFMKVKKDRAPKHRVASHNRYPVLTSGLILADISGQSEKIASGFDESLVMHASSNPLFSAENQSSVLFKSPMTTVKQAIQFRVPHGLVNSWSPEKALDMTDLLQVQCRQVVVQVIDKHHDAQDVSVKSIIQKALSTQADSIDDDNAVQAIKRMGQYIGGGVSPLSNKRYIVHTTTSGAMLSTILSEPSLYQWLIGDRAYSDMLTEVLMPILNAVNGIVTKQALLLDLQPNQLRLSVNSAGSKVDVSLIDWSRAVPNTTLIDSALTHPSGFQVGVIGGHSYFMPPERAAGIIGEKGMVWSVGLNILLLIGIIKPCKPAGSLAPFIERFSANELESRFGASLANIVRTVETLYQQADAVNAPLDLPASVTHRFLTQFNWWRYQQEKGRLLNWYALLNPDPQMRPSLATVIRQLHQLIEWSRNFEQAFALEKMALLVDKIFHTAILCISSHQRFGGDLDELSQSSQNFKYQLFTSILDEYRSDVAEASWSKASFGDIANRVTKLNYLLMMIFDVIEGERYAGEITRLLSSFEQAWHQHNQAVLMPVPMPMMPQDLRYAMLSQIGITDGQFEAYSLVQVLTTKVNARIDSSQAKKAPVSILSPIYFVYGLMTHPIVSRLIDVALSRTSDEKNGTALSKVSYQNRLEAFSQHWREWLFITQSSINFKGRAGQAMPRGSATLVHSALGRSYVKTNWVAKLVSWWFASRSEKLTVKAPKSLEPLNGFFKDLFAQWLPLKVPAASSASSIDEAAVELQWCEDATLGTELKAIKEAIALSATSTESFVGFQPHPLTQWLRQYELTHAKTVDSSPEAPRRMSAHHEGLKPA